MNDNFELIRCSGDVFHDFGRAIAGLEQVRAILAGRSYAHSTHGAFRHARPKS